MKLTDEESIDKVNPFEPSQDAHLPGAVRQSGNYIPFRQVGTGGEREGQGQGQWVVIITMILLLLLYFLRR